MNITPAGLGFKLCEGLRVMVYGDPKRKIGPDGIAVLRHPHQLIGSTEDDKQFEGWLATYVSEGTHPTPELLACAFVADEQTAQGTPLLRFMAYENPASIGTRTEEPSCYLAYLKEYTSVYGTYARAFMDFAEAMEPQDADIPNPAVHWLQNYENREAVNMMTGALIAATAGAILVNPDESAWNHFYMGELVGAYQRACVHYDELTDEVFFGLAKEVNELWAGLKWYAARGLEMHTEDSLMLLRMSSSKDHDELFDSLRSMLPPGK